MVYKQYGSSQDQGYTHLNGMGALQTAMQDLVQTGMV